MESRRTRTTKLCKKKKNHKNTFYNKMHSQNLFSNSTASREKIPDGIIFGSM
jgi:hypothetical protein